MSDSVQAVIQRRRNAIVLAYARTPVIMVQVESPSALSRLAFADLGPGLASPGQLGRRDAGKVAFVEDRANRDLNSSVWVAAVYDDYRGAYLRFLNEAYGLSATTSDLSGFDVDHLLNRARSPRDGTFIRIEATPSFANQEWGRLFEKAASDPRFYANTNRERRNMSWVICAKLAGQLPPNGPDDRAGVERLASFFASIGINRAEARDGLTSMLAFAYKFRGRGG